MRVFTHVLFALIALQLAFGLQVATAAVAYAPSDPCPVHKDMPKPADKHDCCKLSGNQCQCSTLALAIDVVTAGAAPGVPFVSAAMRARPASALAESHFRPPIAS